jgi:hypothetical protein
MIQFVFDSLFEFFGYGIARLALPILSFGKIYAQPLHSADNSFNVLGYRRDAKGRIEISSIVAASLGLVLALLGLCLFGFLVHSLI